jgi:hypothetical protein
MAELITNPEFSRYLDDLEHEIDPSAASFWVCYRFFVAASFWMCYRFFVAASFWVCCRLSVTVWSQCMCLHPSNTNRYSALYGVFYVFLKTLPYDELGQSSSSCIGTVENVGFAHKYCPSSAGNVGCIILLVNSQPFPTQSLARWHEYSLSFLTIGRPGCDGAGCASPYIRRNSFDTAPSVAPPVGCGCPSEPGGMVFPGDACFALHDGAGMLCKLRSTSARLDQV